MTIWVDRRKNMMESCKKSKRVVGLLLIFVFLLSCIGCQKNNKVTTNTYENNTEELDIDDSMLINDFDEDDE